MIKVIDTTDEYNVYSYDGLKSGETVFVKEDESVHFLTNNINGNTQTINAYTSAEENVQSDWAQTDTEADDYIKNKPTLATVATSGDYDDLTDKPSIPANTSDLNNDSGFVTSTTSGLKIEVVTAMPADPANDTIYFVKNNS